MYTFGMQVLGEEGFYQSEADDFDSAKKDLMLAFEKEAGKSDCYTLNVRKTIKGQPSDFNIIIMGIKFWVKKAPALAI